MQTRHATPDRLNLPQRIWYSIFPAIYGPKFKREDGRSLLNTLVLHFRPKVVRERTLRFTLTWGLGGMAVVLVCLLFTTGTMMKFAYQPVPDRAYESIVHLQDDVFLGQLIRNIHHWSANVLLVVVFLHLMRVFFTGAFQSPREFNWIIGLMMFFALLVSNFTGYLLPWDQLAFWAVTICTAMLDYLPIIGEGLQRSILGGIDIGPSTLSNFFAIHTAVVPACLIVLMPFHFWRVRKAGGLVVPRSPGEDPAGQHEWVPTIPYLIVRELVVALILIATIMLVSVLFDAPLGAKANPGLSPNPTKAPWYFAGIQELLLHFHPLFAVAIPITVVGALISVPYVRYDANTAGVWFASSRGRRMASIAALFAFILAPLGIIVDEFLVDFVAWAPGVPAVLTNGLLPAGLALAIVVAFYGVIKKRYNATNNEAIQSVFVVLLVIFIILTITGIWFRGAGMALTWPWRTGPM